MTTYIVDTETTDKDTPELIEYAHIQMSDDIDDFAPRDALIQRYSPAGKISFGAMATHHILPGDLEGKPASSTFVAPGDMKYMIGHNVDFDWRVTGELNVKRICTLAMSRRVWPDASSHTLGTLSYMTSGNLEDTRVELKNAHSALNDCYLCLNVLYAIVDQCGEQFSSWEDIYQFSELSRIPTHMGFGKYAGKLIADVPYDYRAWYSRQPNPDPYLLKAFGAPYAS